MKKGKIVKIGTVENGVASFWTFDGVGVDGVVGITIETDNDGNEQLLACGYTIDELQQIANSGMVVPPGAKVTIEWDEDVHQCERLAKRGLKVERQDGSNGWWYVTSAREAWKDWVGPIDYCPCCREKLE